MLSTPLCTPLVFLIIYVAAVAAVPSLTVGTSTSNVDINGLENFKVTATIANTGDGILKLLNDPRGVLNPFPENSFTITDPSGSRLPFTGDSVDYDPVDAANLDRPNTFTVLAPGDSVNVTHDLPAAYSFTQSGTGNYSIEPSNLFTYIDADGVPKDLHATVDGIANVKLSGDPAVSRRVHDKRIRSKKRPKLNVICGHHEKQIVEMAVWRAYDTFAVAYSSLKHNKNEDAYQTWFGVWNSRRHKSIVSNFKAARDMLQKITYQCGCTGHEEVYTDKFGFKYRDRESVTTLAMGYIGIHGGGGDEDRPRDQAIRNPDSTVHSLDNYLFFAKEIQQGRHDSDR